MLTETRKNLIDLLIFLKFKTDKIIDIIALCQTDKNMNNLFNMIIDRYKEKNSVTEEDVLKMILYLTREE